MLAGRLVSGVGIFALGALGGVVGVRLFPADGPLTPLSATPAVAEEIKVSPPQGGEDGIADLVDKVKVAVVNIDTVAHRLVPNQLDPFRFFFEGGGDQPPVQREEKGVGSGFVVGANGLIVTNHHVVRGADKLTVTFHDGKKFPGKVIGQDPGTDLALVRIEAKGLSTLKLADPERLRVGQYVVAMGSPLGLSQSVTTGILSAINRDIALNARVGFLQTDAPINPGNSGGPLLNLRGEVIGVNTAIAARGQGIGFAVPVETVRVVLPQLEKSGRVERPWLGVGITGLPEDRSKMFYPVEHGVLVGRVERGGPAEAAGLVTGDVILSVNGQTLESPGELIREVAKHSPGETVELLVSRQGQTKTFKLKLQKMPEQAALTGSEGQED
ncbi:MAG: trypsin-like peptidase domain-containing protein [Candidatus Sericytochromatia bacterium]|nr:trypsin-like peptidase domain-containing protein [Candidatus Sericytochromatia bacterium]